MTLYQVAEEIARRNAKIYHQHKDGKRPVFGGARKFQEDPYWRDCLLFYEYFQGDNGARLGRQPSNRLDRPRRARYASVRDNNGRAGAPTRQHYPGHRGRETRDEPIGRRWRHGAEMTPCSTGRTADSQEFEVGQSGVFGYITCLVFCSTGQSGCGMTPR
jgi:hypothetical protein